MIITATKYMHTVECTKIQMYIDTRFDHGRVKPSHFPPFLHNLCFPFPSSLTFELRSNREEEENEIESTHIPLYKM